jgi:hypothetical protein
VLIDRINVGGNESGQPSEYVRLGSLDKDNTWYLDGVNLTDMGAIGNSPAYYNFDSFEELQTTTGGSDTSISAGGVVLNMVTKRGTNEWRGSANYLLSTAGDFDDDAFQQPGGDLYNGGSDFSATAGGPLRRGRLWFFGAFASDHADRERFAEGDRIDANFGANTFTGKVNANIAPNNRATGLVSIGRWDRDGIGAGSTRPAETTWNQSGPTDIYKIEDSHIFNSNFYLTGLASYVNGGFQLAPQGGSATPFELFNEPMRGSYYRVNSDRTSKKLKLSGSYFFNTGTISHELKFGAGYRSVTDTTIADWPSGTFTIFDSPTAEPVAFFPTVNESKVALSYTSAYVQDTIMLDRFTVNVGLRYDVQSVENRPSVVSPNPIRSTTVPGGSFDGGEIDVDGSGVAPRLGVTYDVLGNGKSKVYASWAQFHSQVPIGAATFVNPIETEFPFSGAEVFRFIDANGNRTYDATEAKGPSVFAGPPANQPAFFETLNRYADGVKVPHTDEFLGGIEFEVARSVALGVRYVHRDITEIIDDYLLVDDGVAVRAAVPGDYQAGPFLPVTDADGDEILIPTELLRSDRAFTSGLERTTGSREQSYTGVAVTFNKRLANRWMLRGHVSYDDWTWDVPADTFFDGNNFRGSIDNDGAGVAPSVADERKSNVFPTSAWSYNVNGLYEIAPDRPWSFHVAGNVWGRQGYPVLPFIRVEDLGDGLSRDIEVGAPGDDRYDSVHIVDARVAKDVRFNRADMTIGLEIFNLMGSDTTVQSEANLDVPARLQPTELVTPRTFRFSLGFRF